MSSCSASENDGCDPPSTAKIASSAPLLVSPPQIQFPIVMTASTIVVEIKSVPSTRVVALREIVANYNAQGPLWDRLFAFVGPHQIPIAGSCFTIFYDQGYKPSDVDNEVCLPIPDDATIPSDVPADIRVYNLPELPRVASVVHKGPYSGLKAVYEELFGWLHAHGERCNGPNREIYHVGMEAHHDESDYVTEILIPLV